ncbi:DUF1700 domain-containing protein [Blautia schinkii]|nr:DUF1700 domain-containing protein [Blautia schinkii]
MNRETYMKCLEERLRRLPKEDFEMAMEYFREYFDEAGPENEEQAIRDLGDPHQAAEQVIMDLAIKNSESTEHQSVKKNFSSVWVGILAVFAAPIALPLAFAVVMVIGALAISILAVLFSLVVSEAGVLLAGVVSIILSFITMFQAPFDSIATIGAGLICIGLALLIIPATVKLTKLCLRGFTRLFANIVSRFSKGGRHDEKEI